MKINWPIALLSCLCIIPGVTMLPYGQQEALAQVGFAQTIEPCRHAGPGYDQVFMCADGEKLRVYSQRPFLSGHYIEIVPEGIVEWNPVTSRAVRRMKLKAGKDAGWSDSVLRDGIYTTDYVLEEQAKGGSLKSGKSAKSSKKSQ